MRTRTLCRCQACGAETPRWVGRCPDCEAWGTLVEETVGPRASKPSAVAVAATSLASQPPTGAARLATGIDEVDRVLGGGLVTGSVLLLAGEPGIGKSTLVLQVAASLAAGADVLLVCGEESPAQVRARAARLGAIPDRITTVDDPRVDAVIAAIGSGPAVVVVDSIQTVFDPEIASAPGSVGQVRECASRLAREARDRGTTLVLVGHVTKDGSVAGPRALEHLVDAVLSFDGDRSAGLRILRALKNRFGSTQEAGFFEMDDAGLVPIRDASAYLLADRCEGVAGSVLAACVEGRRPYVLEVQALVASSGLQVPRRVAQGVENARIPLLVAVLERRAGLSLGDKDVFVSAVGGMRAAEPAADLPLALAIVSSQRGVPVPGDVAAFGEVGLAGEIRRAPAGDLRVAEARAVGCRRVVVPAGYDGPQDGIELIRVGHLRDVMRLFAAKAD